MADVTTMPGVNGSFVPHQGYGGLDGQQAHTGAYNAAPQPSYGQAPPTSSTPTTTASSQPEIPKDEVGWYFVEQYYTTLSRSPEKLYLFYNKRSQFVSGQETDKVGVCVGQRAINDKIKELDFQEAKVRVTNVDSQASDSNIVIQVIGEISNKSQPHKKFTQTFVLATQTNGYFVLNDIFRYLIEEEDEAEAESAPQKEEEPTPAAETGAKEIKPTAEVFEPKSLTSSADPVAVEHDAAIVDTELEKKASEPLAAEKEVPEVNGEEKTEEKKENEAPAAVESKPEPAAVPKKAPVAAEKPEKPAEPTHTPVASTPKPATPVAAPKPVPVVPKTWASLAAAASGGAAAPSAPASSAASTTSQTRAAPAAAKAAAPAAAPSAPAAQPAQTEEPSAPQQDEWTAVGGNHGRQQSRQVTTQQQEGPQNRGYIKNVQDSVDADALKTHLQQFGEVTYFDISRQKNCAFVDFKTVAGYEAAVAANPHVIGSARLTLEERRPRPGQGQAPFAQRGQFQGGRGGNRGGPNRGNFQGGQGRGNAPARGGRGGRGGAAPAS